MTTSLEIESTDGLTLEAALEGPEPPRKVLVFCHPHPQMGGTMNAPLLRAVRDELVAADWTVLRFNFRGIGASEGTAGTGIDEIADAEGALAFVTQRFPSAPVSIAGWSFGAAVAVRTAARNPELRACVAIAPAVAEKPGITAGLPDPDELRLSLPLLVVAAANDKLSVPADARAWAAAAGAGYVEIAGANHFFWARYAQLSAAIMNFLDNAPLRKEGFRPPPPG